MEEHTNFDVLRGIYWQVVIEFCRFLIELNQQKLIHPVKTDVENHSEWVQNWKTS